MNWTQRTGVVSLVLSALLAGATWGTQVNHAVNPVPIAELGLTPEAAQATREAVAGMQPLQVVGADSDADNRAKRIMLTAALKDAAGGNWPFHGPQEIGDCASFGAARAIEIDEAVQIKAGAEIEWRPVDRPWLYSGGRTQNGRVQLSGDGSVPSWIVEHTESRGVLWADTPGLDPYNGRRAKQWGSKPPPSEWADDAEPYKVAGAAAIKSAQEACNALAAGYPLTFGSMNFGTNSIKLVEGRNVARDTTAWPHAQACVGYDGTTKAYGSKGLFRIDNSWGPEAHNPKSTLPEDAPGGYYVTWQDFDSICREGMCFAISGTQGFPKRDLNWDVFNAVGAAAPAQPEGGMIMFEIDPTIGYLAAAALLIAGVVLLVLGRAVKNFHRGGLRIAAFTLATLIITSADAQDALSFGAFADNEKSTSTTSRDSNNPLSFAVFSGPQSTDSVLSFAAFRQADCNCIAGDKCRCGADCDCKAKHSTAAEARQGELWMFSPKYCLTACPAAKRNVGSGDARTRIIVKEHEAHFTPRDRNGKEAGYPCFFDPVRLKQWSGVPKDMSDLRRQFGDEPPLRPAFPAQPPLQAFQAPANCINCAPTYRRWRW